jgi:hypothetical protein
MSVESPGWLLLKLRGNSIVPARRLIGADRSLNIDGRYGFHRERQGVLIAKLYNTGAARS